MAILRHSAANESEDTYDVFNFPTVRLFDRCTLILLGDMNANLGDSESPGVGSFSEDHENDNGTRLRAFAAECNMAFMNTFFDDVPLSTWRASRGQEHRIGYTAISMKDISRVVHAGVCKDINMAFSTEIDHWPVAMQVRMFPPK